MLSTSSIEATHCELVGIPTAPSEHCRLMFPIRFVLHRGLVSVLVVAKPGTGELFLTIGRPYD